MKTYEITYYLKNTKKIHKRHHHLSTLESTFSNHKMKLLLCALFWKTRKINIDFLTIEWFIS